MYLVKYLLCIKEFMDTENGEALMERAFLYVDGERREKAARMRPGRARAASLGAGLLLQLAVREAAADAGKDRLPCCGVGVRGHAKDGLPCCSVGASGHGPNGETGTPECECGRGRFAEAASEGKAGDAEPGRVAAVALEKNFSMRQYAVGQLLEALQDKPPLLLTYTYGKGGKPGFRNLPFFFNLSHSGEYVLCVIATEEIGADIQQHCSGGHGKPSAREGRNFYGQGEGDYREKNDYPGRFVGRFFSERECAALEQAGEEREKLFFRLWARKEAYGKLTGKGVAGVLNMDMLPWEDGDVSWSEVTDRHGKNVPGPEGHCPPKTLSWEEYGGLEGYSIAVCRYS